MDYEKLIGKTWGTNPTMISFFKSKDFKKIVQTLKEESLHSREIFPKGEEIFRPFRLCPMDRTMVVFLGTNPYYQEKTWTDGILFSASKLIKGRPKLLSKLFRGIEDNYDQKMGTHGPDLSDWAKQGALFLPLDLTMKEGTRGRFKGTWEPFIDTVLSTLQEYCPGVIYVLLGQDALRIQNKLDIKSSDIILVEHPAKSLALKRNWKNKNLFTYLDRVTNMIHGRKINWLRK